MLYYFSEERSGAWRSGQGHLLSKSQSQDQGKVYVTGNPIPIPYATATGKEALYNGLVAAMAPKC